MAKFVKFLRHDKVKNTVFVNPEAVRAVRPAYWLENEAVTIIDVGGEGGDIYVVGNVEAVVAKLASKNQYERR